MLRGSFGYALKETVCINPTMKCTECFAAHECLYYTFYEKQNHYHPYRFDVDLSPEKYDFSLLLFQHATSQLPYILSALVKMVTTIGLGSKKKTYTDFTILCGDQCLYEQGRFLNPKIDIQKFSYKPLAETFTLRFATPLRMKYRNEFLKSAPALEQVLHSIHLRYEELSDRGRSPLGYEPSYHQMFTRTRFLDLGRYSNRQESKLNIGGIVGEIRYSGVDEHSRTLLRLGELIGVGKQTVFGMGKILLEDTNV